MPSFVIHTGQKRCFQKLILSDVKGSCELNSKMLSQEDFSLQRFWIQLSSWNSRFSLKPRRGVYLSTPLKKKETNFFHLTLQTASISHTPTAKIFPADYTEKFKVVLQYSKKIAKSQLHTSVLIDYQPFLPLWVKFTITIASHLPRSSFKKKALTMLQLASEVSNLFQTSCAEIYLSMFFSNKFNLFLGKKKQTNSFSRM